MATVIRNNILYVEPAGNSFRDLVNQIPIWHNELVKFENTPSITGVHFVYNKNNKDSPLLETISREELEFAISNSLLKTQTAKTGNYYIIDVGPIRKMRNLATVNNLGKMMTQLHKAQAGNTPAPVVQSVTLNNQLILTMNRTAVALLLKRTSDLKDEKLVTLLTKLSQVSKMKLLSPEASLSTARNHVYTVDSVKNFIENGDLSVFKSSYQRGGCK